MHYVRIAARFTFSVAVVVAVAVVPGGATLFAASDVCVENPLEGIGRPPRDTSPCGSLTATLLAVGAAFFEDCSPNNPEMSRKYSEIAARYVGMPPNVGLPAMAAELTAEIGKDGTRCAIRAVVREGLPFSRETREELVSVVNGIFELQDIRELVEDVESSGPRTALAEREQLAAKFQKELNERIEGNEGLRQSTSDFDALKAKVLASLTSHESQARSALDASAQGLDSCAVDETAARLLEAVRAGRQGLIDTRQAIRAAEREQECAEQSLRRQYGPDWNLRQAIISGPTLNEYRYAIERRQMLERTEAALVETLQQAGANCGRLKQQADVSRRMLEHYAAARVRAAQALESGPCDLSAAEEALKTLRNLEGSPCGSRLGTRVSGEVEARIASRKSERRMSDACNEGVPDGGVDSFSGAWQCPQRGIITLQANVDSGVGSVTGSVTGRPGEHWGAGQRAGGRITGTVTGRTLQLVMESGDGTVSRLSGTLTIDGRSFSGPWEWFRGETRLAGGTWNCQRPADFVPPSRSVAPAEVVPPAAAGPMQVSFRGLVIDVLYERSTDDRGVPIDIYFYRNRAIPGAPVPQGEQEWNRFVRVPAAGSSSTEPVVWWHARWTYGAEGWVSVSEKGITPPQAVP